MKTIQGDLSDVRADRESDVRTKAKELKQKEAYERNWSSLESVPSISDVPLRFGLGVRPVEEKYNQLNRGEVPPQSSWAL
jgi:hypothetical protein